jgi:hypothetical protein
MIQKLLDFNRKQSDLGELIESKYHFILNLETSKNEMIAMYAENMIKKSISDDYCTEICQEEQLLEVLVKEFNLNTVNYVLNFSKEQKTEMITLTKDKIYE